MDRTAVIAKPKNSTPDLHKEQLQAMAEALVSAEGGTDDPALRSQIARDLIASIPRWRHARKHGKDVVLSVTIRQGRRVFWRVDQTFEDVGD